MNQQPITISATVACWVSKEYGLRDLNHALERGDKLQTVHALAFYGEPERTEFGAWVRAGEADVTIRLLPHDERTRMTIQALQDQLAEERVKWHQRQEAILAEISKLSALTFEPADARTVEA